MGRAAARSDLDESRLQLHLAMLDTDKLFFRPGGRVLLADIGDLLTQYLRTVDHVTDLLAQDGKLKQN